MKLNKIMVVMVVSSALVLSGCSAMGTAVKKRNLEVKTQMSETIWLEPSNNKTVYLQIKNTSDKDMSGLQSKITSAVTAKGYQVVTNPDTAGYWIQANVLKADKMDLRETQGWLSRGYEGAATGTALGAGITAYNSSSAGATLGVGLAAGLVGMAADAMVEDVNYTMMVMTPTY
ncbi:Lipoprotein YlpA (plasmid) [Klebsiella oxytoca]|nr:Lipoprotein YlpA [Klebsiella oxytoca]CAH3945260.1 Lipoprotein YlpA [Klebsiella oxytoca]